MDNDYTFFPTTTFDLPQVGRVEIPLGQTRILAASQAGVKCVGATCDGSPIWEAVTDGAWSIHSVTDRPIVQQGDWFDHLPEEAFVPLASVNWNLIPTGAAR